MRHSNYCSVHASARAALGRSYRYQYGARKEFSNVCIVIKTSPKRCVNQIRWKHKADRIADCPVPRFWLRNGRLNQLAYSF